jgi:FO synthase
MPSTIARILDTALAGESLSAADGYRLADSNENETALLLSAAGQLRDKFKGRIVTYSRKVFLPITNLCADRCSYCTFRKDPDDPEAWTMSPDEIDRTIDLALRLGCKEALMCLGDKPERAYPSYRATLAAFGHSSTTDYIYRACRMALDRGLLPHTNAGLLQYGEMRRLKEVNASLGLMLENISPRLRRKGMAHFSAPDKDPLLRLRMLREAGELAIPFTTGILIGIGETRAERVDSIMAIRELHETHGHIQEVIIQNFRAKPGTRMAAFPEPEDLEIARTVALARLLLGRMNLQAPPNLNPEAHRLLLRAGINDWGGISPVTPDYINPEAAWPHIEQLAITCREEGFTLRERLAVYPEYLDHPRFLDPAVRPRAGELQTAISV